MRCDCKYGTPVYTAAYKSCLRERRLQARLAKKRKKVPGSSGVIDFARLIEESGSDSSTDYSSSDDE